MSQPSPDSEQQFESPQPRIEQHSNGNMFGGQQAAIGHDINQSIDQSQDNSTNYNNCDFHIYYGELQDEDLEPLGLKSKVFSYLGVFIFLVLTLIFWFFFGLFISFPFPYHQVIELIGSCFKRQVASKINSLQKQLQLESVDNQSVENLGKIDLQSRLYLKILECLGANNTVSNERLAKTIETLKEKRTILQEKIKNSQNEIPPRQYKKYQTVSEAQDFFESLTLSQTEKDLAQIETILREVAQSVRSGDPSETIVQDTINKLSRELTRKANKISPSKLGLLYRLQSLLREISDKEISNLEESDLNDLNRKMISDLRRKRDTLARDLNTALDQNNVLQQAVNEYLDNIHSLNSFIDERESDWLKLQKKIEYYAKTDQTQQITINTLNSNLVNIKERLRGLHEQKNALNEEMNQLKKALYKKQVDIDKLKDQVNQYSGVRVLNGDYIGNLSDRRRKYHFNPKCPSWKMLVGDYVLGLDLSREIVSSGTPNFFLSKSFNECNTCKKL